MLIFICLQKKKTKNYIEKCIEKKENEWRQWESQTNSKKTKT